MISKLFCISGGDVNHIEKRDKVTLASGPDESMSIVSENNGLSSNLEIVGSYQSFFGQNISTFKQKVDSSVTCHPHFDDISYATFFTSV